MPQDEGKQQQQACGCPLHPKNLGEMCSACQIDWEDWMDEIAMPALRAALAFEARLEETSCTSAR